MTESVASFERISVHTRSVVCGFAWSKEGLAANRRCDVTIYDWTGEDG